MLLAAVVFAILVYGVISSMLGSLLPLLGFTGEQNGTLALMQASGLAVSALSAGPFVDMRGKKTAMVAGLSAMAIALWSLPSAAGNFPLMAILWLLLGLGGGVMGTTSNSLLSEIGGARRSAVLNWGNVFFGVGLMITPFLASNVFDGNVRGSCFFAAALVTGTLVWHILIKARPVDPGNVFRWADAKRLLHHPAMHLFCLYAFLYVACEVGVSNWLVKFLIAEGIQKEHALKIMSLGFAFGLLTGRFLASRILSRVPAIGVVMAAPVLMTLTTFAMLHVGGGETATAIVVFCTGLSMSAAFPTILGLAGDVFPQATGTAIGLVITSGWAGLAVSSSIIGAVAGADESNLASALLLFPLFSMAMIGVSWRIRQRVRAHSGSR